MNRARIFVSLALVGAVSQLLASPPVIGVARSWGAFFVNDAAAPGTATVFDGTLLKTTDASSNLNLLGGERVMLASNSVATFHQNLLLLDRGVAEFSGSAVYRIVARNLRVETPDPSARIRVGIDRQNRVLVASLGGAAEVRNARGVLVAHVAPGASLMLSAASPEAVDVTGVVQMRDGKFYLVDDVTSVQMELRASGLSKLVGKRLHVTGTTGTGDSAAAVGAPQVVVVDTATVVTGTAGGAAAGAGVTTSSISTTTIAIAGGVVAVGGTVGGLAATGVIGGTSSVSR